ncbi:MAG: hypothetical protein OEW58_11035 [Gammaproteobacteria bacterium]|nr:hypothetical protein [Gammaproteobacteria bacterium]
MTQKLADKLSASVRGAKKNQDRDDAVEQVQQSIPLADSRRRADDEDAPIRFIPSRRVWPD